MHNRSITICIGDITIGFYAEESIAQWEIVRKHYKDFLARTKPSIAVRIKKANGRLPRIKKTIAATNSWALGTNNGKWIIYFYQKDGSPSVALIHPSFKKVDFLTTNNDLVPIMYGLPVILFLLEQKKYKLSILHACGIMDKKRGYLFAAPSGGGKSTIAKLSRGKTILSDDRILLRKVHNGFKIYGSPWSSKNGVVSNKSVLIKKIFFLEKADSVRIRPLNNTQAIKELLKNTFYFFTSSDIINLLIKRYTEVIKEVSCYKLGFRPDGSVWRFLEQFNKGAAV